MMMKPCRCGLTQHQLDLHKLVGEGGVCTAFIDEARIVTCNQLLKEHPIHHLVNPSSSAMLKVPSANAFKSSVFILCALTEDSGGAKPLASCFAFTDRYCLARRHCLYQKAKECTDKYEKFAIARSVKHDICELVAYLDEVFEDEGEDWVIFERRGSKFKAHLEIAHLDEQPRRDEHVVLVSAPVGILTSGNMAHLRVDVSPPTMVYEYTFDLDSLQAPSTKASADTLTAIAEGFVPAVLVIEEDEEEAGLVPRRSSLDMDRSVLVVHGGQTSGTCGGPYLTLDTHLVAAVQLWSFSEATPRGSDVSALSSDSVKDLQELTDKLDTTEKSEELDTHRKGTKAKRPREPPIDEKWRGEMMNLLLSTLSTHAGAINQIGDSVDSTQATYHSFNAGSVLSKLPSFRTVFAKLTGVDLTKPREAL